MTKRPKHTVVEANIAGVLVPPSTFTMTCGNCGYAGFKLEVVPDDKTMQAKLSYAECWRCKMKFRMDDQSGFEKTGKYNVKGLN